MSALQIGDQVQTGIQIIFTKISKQNKLVFIEKNIYKVSNEKITNYMTDVPWFEPDFYGHYKICLLFQNSFISWQQSIQ